MALHDAGARPRQRGLGPLLEVGTYCGKSAVLPRRRGARRGHRAVHRRPSPRLGGEPGGLGAPRRRGRRPRDRPHGHAAVLPPHDRRRADSRTRSSPSSATRRPLPRAWKTPLAFLFIDGGHGDDPALADYRGWTPHLARRRPARDPRRVPGPGRRRPPALRALLRRHRVRRLRRRQRHRQPPRPPPHADLRGGRRRSRCRLRDSGSHTLASRRRAATGYRRRERSASLSDARYEQLVDGSETGGQALAAEESGGGGDAVRGLRRRGGLPPRCSSTARRRGSRSPRGTRSRSSTRRRGSGSAAPTRTACAPLRPCPTASSAMTHSAVSAAVTHGRSDTQRTPRSRHHELSPTLAHARVRASAPVIAPHSTG